jgi:hypothetical protein
VLQQLGWIDILVNVLGGSSAPGGGFAALDGPRVVGRRWIRI